MRKAFIGMETSGRLRCALQSFGWYVVSVDLLPAIDIKNGLTMAGGHWQGDVFDVFSLLTEDYGMSFDLGIFHPDCTYLTNSAAWAYKDPDYDRYPGVGYHQKTLPGTLVGLERRVARSHAINTAKACFHLPITRVVVENPIGALSKAWRKPDQILQPYQFGDDASKATCLWLKRVRKLVIDPSRRFQGRLVPRHRAMGKSDRENGNKGPEYLERWGNQTDTGQNRLSPSEGRWQKRSETYPGIAQALAEQITRGFDYEERDLFQHDE